MLPTILFLALAQPPAPAVVELPAPPAAKWVELKAAAVPYYLGAADKKPMKWVAVDENCWVEPQDGGKAAALYAVAAGTYRLIAIPEAGDPVKVRVTVGDAPAPPPKPPLPPAPPADPLAQRLLAAYQTDPGTPEVKAATKAKLADVYREAAKLADNGRFATCGDLLDVIHEAAKSISDDLLTRDTDVRRPGTPAGAAGQHRRPARHRAPQGHGGAVRAAGRRPRRDQVTVIR
jgi:hypothetical protein